MAIKNEIDTLDRKILLMLQEDARMPYLEIARKLLVSGGTIHQRLDRLKEIGVIKGHKIILDREKLGLGVTVLLGVNLQSAKQITPFVAKLKNQKEVIEAFYTTGQYALIIKVCVASIKDFHLYLSQKLQIMPEVHSTESFICLDHPIERDITLE